VPAAPILLVDADPVLATTIADTLTRVGHAVTTETDPAEAVRGLPGNQLVVIDVLAGGASAAELCEAIRAHPDLARIPILCIAQSDEVDERIRLLEAGADDVVARPFDARELEARVDALILRFQRTKDRVPVASIGSPVGGRRRVAVFFSPKGGVGTTTIAVNVAMAMAQRRPDSVVIVDLDSQFGQVATHLNLPPRQTIGDVVRDDGAMSEAEVLRTYTVRHDSGLHALASAGDPEIGRTVSATHVSRILQLLPGTFDTVVADAGRMLDDRTLAAFEAADVVVFPVIGEIPALNALRGLLDQLAVVGSTTAKAMFVLNGVLAREVLRPADVERAIGTRIEGQLPYDPFLYLKAVNAGNPIVRSAPRTPPADALVELADHIFGSPEPVAEVAPTRDDRKGLLSGFRRR